MSTCPDIVIHYRLGYLLYLNKQRRNGHGYQHTKMCIELCPIQEFSLFTPPNQMIYIECNGFPTLLMAIFTN